MTGNPGGTGSEEKKLQLIIEDAVAEGQYSNLVLVTHNETEFVLDFAYAQPEAPKARVKARIQLHPKQAKRLMMVLGHRVRQYEATFGDLGQMPGQGGGNPPIH